MMRTLRIASAQRRRGVILPIVLVVVGLLAVIMTGFVFFVQAETAGVAAQRDQQQARLAAESGLEEVIAVLRLFKHDASQWYNVPQRFRHALVGSTAFDREHDPARQAGSRADLIDPSIQPEIAWRYSACAPGDNPQLQLFRYGVTPESSKLNLNAATPEQLNALFTPLLVALQIENSGDLISALLDWRDADDDARTGGAENEWYNTLRPAYRAKNGPFDTVEELLLVRGWNAIALWGEDVNRNGMLDPNEDDGDASWPYWDNADGVLNPGVGPFLTVFSREPDTTLANKPRINLNGNPALISAQVAEYFPEGEISAATVNFITQLKGSGFNFAQLTSPAQLYTQGYVPPAELEGLDELGEEGDPTSQPTSQPTGVLPEELMGSPVTLAELPYILDAFSVQNPQQQQPQPGQPPTAGGVVGLININTAPPQVLSILPGLTPDVVASIVATRATLTAEDLRTPAWLVAGGLVDTATFHAVAPYITAKAYQFEVQIVGYADHVKTARRFQWILEMIGPLGQIKYARELTSLGVAWPVDRDSIVTGVAQQGGA